MKMLKTLICLFVFGWLAPANAWADQTSLKLASTTKALLKRFPAAMIRLQRGRTAPAMIRNISVPTKGRSDEARARGFLADLAPLPVKQVAQLKLRRTVNTANRTILRFAQRVDGIEVYGAEITVSLDPKKRVRAVHSNASPIDTRAARLLLAKKRISSDAAKRAACEAISDKNPACAQKIAGTTTLMVDNQNPALPPGLIYVVTFSFGLDPHGRVHLVDAHSSEYIGFRPGVLWEPRQGGRKGGRR